MAKSHNPQGQDDPKALPLTAAAAYLGLQNSALLEVIHRRRIEYFVVGRTYFLPMIALDAFDARELGGFHVIG